MLYQNKGVERTKLFGKLYFLKSDLVAYMKNGTAVRKTAPPSPACLPSTYFLILIPKAEY